MTTKILIMGLPGAGKTYLANELQKELHNRGFVVEWFNADEVRERFNDWDFSEEGRIRQGRRMSDLAEKSSADFIISDFVAPLPAMREAYSADITIWVDTIDEGRFEDTNKIFVPPAKYDYRIMAKSAERWAVTIATKLARNYREQQESHRRSLTKAVTWRVTGTIDTFIVSWLLTGEPKVALSIAGVEFFTKIFLYYSHERIWNKIKWGKNDRTSV
jgi:adenylylsulfate kinase